MYISLPNDETKLLFIPMQGTFMSVLTFGAYKVYTENVINEKFTVSDCLKIIELSFLDGSKPARLDM